MNPPNSTTASQFADLLRRLVFIGFNSRVAALDRQTGSLVWNWTSPKGSSRYVALLLDGDRLIVSVQGYTYCLNPLNGSQQWFNPLPGFGTGIPCLVSSHGSSPAGGAEMMLEEEEAAGAAAATNTTT